MPTPMRYLLFAVLLLVNPAGADPGPYAAISTDPDFIAGRKAIEAKDWKKAIALFSRFHSDADAFNYLGFANRNLGNYEAAFTNYRRALALDPNHRGAHEYVGEAYLLTNNLAKAEEHLAALARICGAGCEEYQDLARAVAAYKKKR
jgi:tetratricopeptide (TPR) repeat protein